MILEQMVPCFTMAALIGILLLHKRLIAFFFFFFLF